MARTTQRVHFVGHADNLLAGIVELPTGSPQGFLLFFIASLALKISRQL